MLPCGRLVQRMTFPLQRAASMASPCPCACCRLPSAAQGHAPQQSALGSRFQGLLARPILKHCRSPTREPRRQEWRLNTSDRRPKVRASSGRGRGRGAVPAWTPPWRHEHPHSTRNSTSPCTSPRFGGLWAFARSLGPAVPMVLARSEAKSHPGRPRRRPSPASEALHRNLARPWKTIFAFK